MTGIMNFRGLHRFNKRRGFAPIDLVDTSACVSSTIDQELSRGKALSAILLMDLLIESAVAERASDVHIDPCVAGAVVRVRMDGSLHDRHTLPLSVHPEIIARIKILSGLRTDEHQAPQDGRFRHVLRTGMSVDVRVSIVPTYYGENAVLRLLSEQAEHFTLERLGFTAVHSEKIARALRKPHGMILATGPTGSGKTTTLYTLIQMLNTRDVSIITVEDPIEYSLIGVGQIQVNARTDLTFANGLRSLLRQDPDIIMVGEIRDVETAGLAVNTALTGHLILSTLHTNDASTTLPRLIDMKVEPYLISSTVTMIIGQRLARQICSDCKELHHLSDAERARVFDVVAGPTYDKDQNFFRGKGCATCNGTGCKGRIGVYEVLEVDAVIRDAIVRKASASEVRNIAIKQGMTPMIVDAFHKAVSGLISIEEVLRLQYE